jgi:Asp-tRNA(Asn)/Glu-tRNA(Gln) amidotransferase A subunit family amidase
VAQYDAAITPAATGMAPGLETTGDARFNSIWSLAGLPTCGLPCGWVGDLPIGMQLAGAADESSLLAVGKWCEAALAFAPRDLASLDLPPADQQKAGRPAV